MEYLSVDEFAKLWHISNRSIRNYCAKGLIEGAVKVGKTWKIPKFSEKPLNQRNGNELLLRLKEEKQMLLKGGIYHHLQVLMAYNSNHIEGSKLTEEQTRSIFDTITIESKEAINVDDIIETNNHFRCFDYVISYAKEELSERFIKNLHKLLKEGTSDSKKAWFRVGDYKLRANEIGGNETTPPEKVKEAVCQLLNQYNKKKIKKIEDIIAFHSDFEHIHPFQDGNGRVGRLIMFKECLANNIIPFIIDEELKFYYYRGLNLWNEERGYLIDTCLSAQDKMKEVLKRFSFKKLD